MSLAVLILVVVQLLLILFLVGVVFQLFRQQGRLALQIESLEEMLPEATSDQGERPSRGLPPASVIQPFDLPDVDGNRVKLEDFKGRRLLLVNWSTTCAFCEAIVKELATLQDNLEQRGVEVVLMSRGDPGENREMVAGTGLRAKIVLQPEGGMVPAFARAGTPAAYLVDEHGRVAKPMALGSEEVPDLARMAAGRQLKLATERPLSESKLRRDGLPPGTKAPDFRLESVASGHVSLEQFSGSPMLLVFTDPECGPCETLAADLAAWHRDHADSGLSVMMVSRGDREVNRRKVEEHAIGFPVALQPGWRLSRAYGVFATPVGYLIDEQGFIVRDVARGPDQILSMARDALESRKEVWSRESFDLRSGPDAARREEAR
jgi:peroxiredoxin